MFGSAEFDIDGELDRVVDQESQAFASRNAQHPAWSGVGAPLSTSSYDASDSTTELEREVSEEMQYLNLDQSMDSQQMDNLLFQPDGFVVPRSSPWEVHHEILNAAATCDAFACSPSAMYGSPLRRTLDSLSSPSNGHPLEASVSVNPITMPNMANPMLGMHPASWRWTQTPCDPASAQPTAHAASFGHGEPNSPTVSDCSTPRTPTPGGCFASLPSAPTAAPHVGDLLLRKLLVLFPSAPLSIVKDAMLRHFGQHVNAAADLEAACKHMLDAGFGLQCYR